MVSSRKTSEILLQKVSKECVHHQKVELGRYLGLRMVLFIKPDFSAYCLREAKPGQKALVMHKDATLVPIQTNPRF